MSFEVCYVLEELGIPTALTDTVLNYFDLDQVESSAESVELYYVLRDLQVPNALTSVIRGYALQETKVVTWQTELSIELQRLASLGDLKRAQTLLRNTNCFHGQPFIALEAFRIAILGNHLDFARYLDQTVPKLPVEVDCFNMSGFLYKLFRNGNSETALYVLQGPVSTCIRYAGSEDQTSMLKTIIMRCGIAPNWLKVLKPVLPLLDEFKITYRIAKVRYLEIALESESLPAYEYLLNIWSMQDSRLALAIHACGFCSLSIVRQLLPSLGELDLDSKIQLLHAACSRKQHITSIGKPGDPRITQLILTRYCITLQQLESEASILETICNDNDPNILEVFYKLGLTKQQVAEIRRELKERGKRQSMWD